jgi:hypothetical protein
MAYLFCAHIAGKTGSAAVPYTLQLPTMVEKLNRPRCTATCDVAIADADTTWSVKDHTGAELIKQAFTMPVASGWVQVGSLGDPYVMQAMVTTSALTWRVTKLMLYLPRVTEIDRVKNI